LFLFKGFRDTLRVKVGMRQARRPHNDRQGGTNEEAASGGRRSCARSASAEQFINILTGGTSGVYYLLGVALSNIYAKAIPDANSSVQATKASVENLNLLQAGRGEIAFALGDSVSLAWGCSGSPLCTAGQLCFAYFSTPFSR
jgi:TRAP-type uncharacterized transport system substrate-binding protein